LSSLFSALRLWKRTMNKSSVKTSFLSLSYSENLKKETALKRKCSNATASLSNGQVIQSLA